MPTFALLIGIIALTGDNSTPIATVTNIENLYTYVSSTEIKYQSQAVAICVRFLPDELPAPEDLPYSVFERKLSHNTYIYLDGEYLSGIADSYFSPALLLRTQSGTWAGVYEWCESIDLENGDYTLTVQTPMTPYTNEIYEFDWDFSVSR